ncbi:MAG: cell division protein FtsZ, partial [Bartonella sp.]|nr:cell division protein FtsZ [Bartonella sp.]
MRKNDPGVTQTTSQSSSSLRSESMVEVIEALEVEMKQPIEEPFCPKSQFFVQTTDTYTPRTVNTAPYGQNIHAKTSSPLRMQVGCVSQQPMAKAVGMEATAHVLDDKARIAEQKKKQVETQSCSTPVRMPELKDFPSSVRGQSTNFSSADQGPRNLWQRLKQSLTYREETEPEARLEPAVNSSSHKDFHISSANSQEFSQDTSV